MLCLKIAFQVDECFITSVELSVIQRAKVEPATTWLQHFFTLDINIYVFTTHSNILYSRIGYEIIIFLRYKNSLVLRVLIKWKFIDVGV